MNRRIYWKATLCLLWLLSHTAAAFEENPQVIRFDRDIRPILSDKCFQCHGPDTAAREAELRLDERTAATDERDGQAAIVPGDSAHSLLIQRVLSDDPDEHMPPPGTGKALTKHEVELLQTWIDQGAPYQAHWSFLPIAAVEPPKVVSTWGRNPIDQFIFRKLQQQGLTPSPPADPQTLIRRICLDLTGLLPEPSDVDQFVAAFAKDADAAVQQLTRELLSSPHYGERWGRHWLDQSRYADSHGYTIDGDRVMWPFRDWVIQAVNDDMPFDRFTIEQLAGDLLPSPSRAQRVATGFHRNTLINQEGGTDNEQFRVEEVVDRVNTTGAVWLGLTLGCAQCHSHKFDPISQREFYEFFAFFNHTVDVNNVGPTVEVSEGELLQKHVDPRLLAELSEANAALAEATKTQSARQADWEQSILKTSGRQDAAVWTQLTVTDAHAEGGADLKRLDDGSVLAGAGAPMETYRLQLQPTAEPIAALRLRLLPHESLPQKGPGRASNGNILLSEFVILADDERVSLDRVQADHAQPGFPVTNVLDGKLDTGWAINVGKGSRPGVKMNAEHEAHFVFTKPLPSGLHSVTVILQHAINANYNIGRFAIDASVTAPLSLARESLLAALKVSPGDRSKDQQKLIADEFQQADIVQRTAARQVAELRRELGLGITVKSMVMQELRQPRATWIHVRGDFLRPDRKTGPLQPGVPAVLPPLDAESPNRLDLAHWLVSDDNPLTARVIVNRVWMRYFGRGLVETENDFGTQGSYPTHPELLDWLADRFRQSWSMKQLHETIITSATYRQSSHHRPELTHLDPRNLLLGRQNRLRVDAEIIRDLGLSASGLLVPKIGGPSVRPPQPGGVYAFTQTKKAWTDDVGENRFRRGLYTHFYRSAPYPMLTTFDAPDFQSVCTRRVRSNTPLQSLTLANDAAFVEMAQGLARRLLTEVPGSESDADTSRVRRAFRICYARPPTAKELAIVSDFQQRQLQLFQGDSKSAGAVAGRTADSYPADMAASWTAVARALMNTDEFVTRE